MSLKLKEYPQQIPLNRLPEYLRPNLCLINKIKPVSTLRTFNGKKNIFEVSSVQCVNLACQDINCRLKNIINI
jgi:hypothetical protein